MSKGNADLFDLSGKVAVITMPSAESSILVINWHCLRRMRLEE